MVAVHRGRLVVAGPHGESFAVVAGRVPEHPTVGDWVAVDDRGVVNARLPRRGVLARVGQELAANVDVAFVVASANRDLNARRLERLVAVAAAGGGDVVLVLNKADLVTDVEPTLAVVRSAAPGVPTLVASAQRGDGVDALAAHLGRGRTGVLLGSRAWGSRRSSTRCSAAGTRAPRRSARTTTAGATRHRTARCSSSRRRGCSSTLRACACRA